MPGVCLQLRYSFEQEHEKAQHLGRVLGLTCLQPWWKWYISKGCYSNPVQVQGLINIINAFKSFELLNCQAVCACFCLAALVTDDYDSFTEPQQDWLSAVRFWRFPDTVSPEETAKLHPSQWQELRNILKWADPTEDKNGQNGWSLGSAMG